MQRAQVHVQPVALELQPVRFGEGGQRIVHAVQFGIQQGLVVRDARVLRVHLGGFIEHGQGLGVPALRVVQPRQLQPGVVGLPVHLQGAAVVVFRLVQLAHAGVVVGQHQRPGAQVGLVVQVLQQLVVGGAEGGHAVLRQALIGNGT